MICTLCILHYKLYKICFMQHNVPYMQKPKHYHKGFSYTSYTIYFAFYTLDLIINSVERLLDIIQCKPYAIQYTYNIHHGLIYDVDHTLHTDGHPAFNSNHKALPCSAPKRY